MSRTARAHLAPSHLVWLALGIVYLVWGSTYLAIRVVVETLPPLLSAGVRFLLAGSLAYAWLALRGGAGRVRVTSSELLGCATVGTALLLGGNGLVSIAEQEVPSGLAALIIASVPLWVVLLRWATRDGVRAGTLVAVPAGFVGVALLLLPGARPAGVGLFGPLLLVAAAASWATGSFLSGRLPLPADPFVSTAVQMLAGGAALVLVGTVRGELWGFRPAEVAPASVWALAYLVVAGSLLAFTAYVWLLQNAPISQVATYAYVNPVVAILLGWAVLGEPITQTVLVGTAIVVGSVAFTVRQEAEVRGEVPEAPPVLAPAECS